MKTNREKRLNPVRIHLELMNDRCSDDQCQLLVKYADATEQGALTRDILIPSDMPLHNLHYAIQRLFGWQNSHLRCFKLAEQDFSRLTGGTVKAWSDLVGVLFQGPQDDDQDAFWDDDYVQGNFKLWLKKKYTGPYGYKGYIESYVEARKGIYALFNHFPVVEVKESFSDYYNRTKNNKDNQKQPLKTIKKAPITALTLDELNDFIMMETGVDHLLERIEVTSVLAVQGKQLASVEDLGKRVIQPVYEMNNGIQEGLEEPEVLPVTHELTYNYDYGDNWVVKITRIDNFEDLLESGAISEAELNLAKQVVMEKHIPVCIAKKGNYVLDDVGGMGGYANFLSKIYESNDKAEKSSPLEWADSLGWSKKKVSLDKML